MHLTSWYNLLSSYLIPLIICTSPTRLTSRSHTLTDNIMSNVIMEDGISGNIINTVSDHLGQFLILPYHLYHSKLKTRNSPKKLWKFPYNLNNFLSDLKKKKKNKWINWESLDFLNINKMSTCFINFFWIK